MMVGYYKYEQNNKTTFTEITNLLCWHYQTNDHIVLIAIANNPLLKFAKQW